MEFTDYQSPDIPVDHPYAEQAEQCREHGIKEARNRGCTCEPVVAVAVVEDINGDLRGIAKVIGHEFHCLSAIQGRNN